MGNRIAPTWGSRLRYALLACAMIVTLIEVIPVSPAQGLSGDTGPAIVPNASTAGLQNANGQWDTKNQHRVWYNADRSVWDALLPMASGANGGPATVESAWWIMKQAVPPTPGALPQNGVEVSTDPKDRPDVFWDEASNELYVLMSGSSTTNFYRYTYSDGSDTYTLAAGPVLVTGMDSSESRAAIFKGPNGDIWASVMHDGGLLVNRSTDNGATWGTPANLVIPVGEGQTQMTSFTSGGTFLAVAASEDGDGNFDGGRYSQYLFYKLDLANVANWNAVTMATGTLAIPTNPTAGETITIGTRTYTFVAAMPAAPNSILIGANAAATQANLVAAMYDDGTQGIEYSSGTDPNPDVVMDDFVANSTTLTAKFSGTSGNSIATLSTMLGAGNGFGGLTLTGGASSWVKETVPLAQTTSTSIAVVHADDEISLVKDSSDNIYIATETQRTGDTQGATSDPQVILYKRTAAGMWTQHNVKLDQASSDFDRKRPVVAIVDTDIYVIAIDNPRTNSSYWKRSLLSALPTGSWGNPVPLFQTEFEAYRNNIVPRDPVTLAQRLPVLIDWAWETGGENTIWQTSLPNSGNQAPGASAGADKTVAASPATTLGATVTNDTLGGPVGWSWTTVSGPGSVIYTNQSGSCATTTCALPTTAAFTALGDYVLRLTATESGTNPLSNSDTVTIHVTNAVNTAPVLTVTNPKNGDSYAQGAGVTFEGSANDNEAGDISADIVWTSSKDGIIGHGGFFVKTDLSLGTHTIVASVTDGQNPVSSTPRVITITSGGGGGGGGVNFIDISGNTFEQDIIWLAEQGITKGCNPPANDKFCPGSYVTRGQMAAFLVRAFGYSNEGSANYFKDTVSTTFEHDINKLFVAGVTKGCNPPANDQYCPGKYVTRAQMAAFLVRAFGYANAGTGNYFLDTVGSIFKTDIDKLRVAGVTLGCNPPTNNMYCPGGNVTRGQMAAFLHRGFGG